MAVLSEEVAVAAGEEVAAGSAQHKKCRLIYIDQAAFLFKFYHYRTTGIVLNLTIEEGLAMLYCTSPSLPITSNTSR